MRKLRSIMLEVRVRPGLRRRVALVLAGLAGLVLVLVLVARNGGCNRTPDDDEPVPADCKPGDRTCHAAVGTETGS